MAIMASLLLLTFVNACGQAPAEGTKSTITASGAWALYPMMVRWAEEYQKSNPSVLIDVSAGGAGKGIADTLSGAADIGMVSRDLSPEEVAQGAFGVAVTKDAVFPMINAKNPVLDELLSRGVSRDALIGIYITGQVTTWGQVINNPAVNAEIHVYTRSDAAGAAEMWAKYLGGKSKKTCWGSAFMVIRAFWKQSSKTHLVLALTISIMPSTLRPANLSPGQWSCPLTLMEMVRWMPRKN